MWQKIQLGKSFVSTSWVFQKNHIIQFYDQDLRQTLAIVASKTLLVLLPCIATKIILLKSFDYLISVFQVTC